MQSYHHNTAPISTPGKGPAAAKKSMPLQSDPPLPRKTAKSKSHSTLTRPPPKPSTSGPVSNYDPTPFSSTTWTSSSGDFGLLSEGDEVEGREDFVNEYNRTAKKYGIRAIVPGDFNPQESKAAPFESKGRRQASSETEATGAQRHLPRRRSISSMTLHLGNSGRKDNFKDSKLADLVRLCGKSLLYLPTEYAPCPLVLPTCLRATAQYLVQQANTRGIFRVPGAVRIVDTLYDYYCTGKDTEEIDQTTRRPILPSHIKFNVHDVASTFKKLLSGLPGGILGSLSVLDSFVAIHSQLDCGPENSRTKETRLRARLIALTIGSISSQYQRELICAVFGLLSLVGRAAETTPREDVVGHPLPTGDLMGYNALGIVFGPLLVGDLLDAYNMKLAVPAAGLVLFPVTPQKPKKPKYLHRHEHGHGKSKTNDDETNAAMTVDKLYVVNSITEMVITNWREVVRHMRSLDVLKIQRNIEQHREASKRRALRPSASDSLAAARPDSWEYRRLPPRKGDRNRRPPVKEPQSPDTASPEEPSDFRGPARPRLDQEQQRTSSPSSVKGPYKGSARLLSPTVEESPLPKTVPATQREEERPPTASPRPSTRKRLDQQTASRGDSPAPSLGAIRHTPEDQEQSTSYEKAKVPHRRLFHHHHGAQHHRLTSHSDTSLRKQFDSGTHDDHEVDSTSAGQPDTLPQKKKKHLDPGKSNGWLPVPKSLLKKWNSSRATRLERSSNDNLSTRTEQQNPPVETQPENMERDPENVGRDPETVSLPSKRSKDKHWFRHSKKVASASRDDRSEISTQRAASPVGVPKLHSQGSKRSLHSLAKSSKDRRRFRKVFSRKSPSESLAETEVHKDVAPDWKRRLLNKFSETRHKPTTPSLTEGASEEGEETTVPTAVISTADGDTISLMTQHPISISQDSEQRVAASRSELGNVKTIVAVFDNTVQDSQTRTSLDSAGRSRRDLRSSGSFRSQRTDRSSRATVVRPSSAAGSSKGKSRQGDPSTPQRDLTPTTSDGNNRSSPHRWSGKGKVTRVPQKTIPSPIRQGHEQGLDRPLSLGTMSLQEQEPPVAQHLALARPSSTTSSSILQDRSTSSSQQQRVSGGGSSSGTPRPTARYPSTNSVLHEQVRSLRAKLESRTEETTQLRRRLEAREMLDTGSLLEQLRQAKREARMWRTRAEAAERRVLALESFSARFRDLKGVCDEEMQRFEREIDEQQQQRTTPGQAYDDVENTGATAAAPAHGDGPRSEGPGYRDLMPEDWDGLDDDDDDYRAGNSSYNDAGEGGTGSEDVDVFEDAVQPQTYGYASNSTSNSNSNSHSRMA